MTTKPQDNPVIGTTECHDCGAAVSLKMSGKGIVYYACNGELENKLCNSYARFSKPKSRELIEQFKNQGKKENVKKTDDRDAGRDGPKPEPKPKRGFFDGIFSDDN